ncbi:MAG: DUF4476 domain-containing protein [Bacteroidia bacterium]
MKAACLFICSLFLSFLSTAQNNLIVLDENGEKFFLFIEGKQVNDSAQTEVKAIKIYEDTFSIKAVFHDKNIPAFTGKVFMLVNGKAATKKEFTYSIARQKDKNKINFISVNDILSDTTLKPQNVETKIMSIFTAEELKKTESDRANGIYPPPEPCKKAIGDSLLQVNLKAMRDNHIEMNRIKDAKWFMSHQCINASQLLELLQIFDYVNSKVDLAKFAFDYMEDHRNFLVIVESIDSPIHKEELKKFYDKRIEK